MTSGWLEACNQATCCWVNLLLVLQAQVTNLKLCHVSLSYLILRTVLIPVRQFGTWVISEVWSKVRDGTNSNKNVLSRVYFKIQYRKAKKIAHLSAEGNACIVHNVIWG